MEMISLSELERTVAGFDERLKPAATRPFNLNDPGLSAKLAQTHDPLDETGLRPEMEAFVAEITGHYAGGDPETRRIIRSLFEKYRWAAWAAAFTRFSNTPEGFRRQLLLFSILDQGQDSREAILSLQHMTAQAISSGIPVKPLLEEVAGYSSEIKKSGMQSTKKMLLNAAQQAGRSFLV
jgi:hypothetical protein